MTTIGVSMVRNERDVIEGTIRHMAGEVDALIVADNGSADGTRDILDKLAEELPLTVVDDPDPAYYQARKMTALAEQAAEAGATWIVPFDADELWIAPYRIADVLAGLDAPVATAALYNHLRTAVDPDDPDPFRSMAWRRPQALPLPKVAFRWEPGCVVHQGNHGVTRPSGGPRVPALEIRHFPYRSAAQFVAKAIQGAAAYAATDLPLDMGAHWRSYGDLYRSMGEAGLERVFRTHYWHLSPTDAGLIRDPAPYMRWRQ